jgi:hypothetical protein
MNRFTVLWALNSAGTAVSRSPILTRSSDIDAGVAAARALLTSAGFRSFHAPSSQSVLLGR